MNSAKFDDIVPALREIFSTLTVKLSEHQPILIVRDLWGRVRYILPERPVPNSEQAKALEVLVQRTHERLGAHAHIPGEALLYGTDFENPIELNQVQTFEVSKGPPSVRILDRQVTGASWSTIQNKLNRGRRVAFYSLKGGVGRSTAAAVAAWHLAQKGRSVLVIDLDLEAPGLSESLLRHEHQPEFGIVDWFVEDAVGQGEDVVRRMTTRSPLAAELAGEIWVTPSHGSNPGEYIAKLGRCYLDLHRGGGIERWEERAARLLADLETIHKPDVVLVDSRSGLHDLASLAVTELVDSVLLFGIGSVQTWAGYRLLFDHWRAFGVAPQIRERLQVVAALVPEIGREDYLSRFQQESWNLFVESLYDALGEGEIEGFSFDLTENSAPHYPLPIFWNRGIASLASFEALDPQLVDAAYGRFLEGLERLFPAPWEA